MIIYLALFLFCFYLFYQNNSRKNTPPTLPYSLPFVGHGLYFIRDPVKYIRNAYRQHGNIFKIKIFRKTMIVICDHDLKREYFKKTEDNLSLYNVLRSLYFDSAFSDDVNKFNNIIMMIKKSVALKYENIFPKIELEADKMIARLNAKDGEEIDIIEEMARYVSNTSYKCFIGGDMTEEFRYNLEKFTLLLNKIVVISYLYPKWLIHFLYGKKLQIYRKNMVKIMISEIESYRQNRLKDDSILLRRGINDGLTNEEIGDVAVCLLYVGTENTALGLTASILDLSKNPKYWELVGKEEEVFKSKLLEACILESARRTSHILGINRMPIEKDIKLGNYNVGNVDCVAICGPLMMLYDESPFKDRDQYNPDRYNSEGKSSYDILTWGAGLHTCPGKRFALYEIMMGISKIVKNLERFEVDDSNNKLDYFSPSAFAENHKIIKIERKNR